MPRSVQITRGKAAASSGLKELTEQLQNVQFMLESDEVPKALLGAAWLIRDRAKELAPVRTGLLKESIFAGFGRPDGRRKKASVVVGVKYGPGHANHAHLIEFGTHKQEAQPFMRPALEQTKGQVQEALKTNISKLIEKAIQ